MTASPFNPEQLKSLKAPINPDRVASREQGGRRFKYVEAVDDIRAANGIFGLGMWDWNVINGPTIVQQGSRPGKGENPPTNWYAWHVHGRLTVRGPEGSVSMDGVGVSIQSSDGAEGAEMAIKAADTDALKRALKNFGDQFGLSLYDKEDAANIDENYQDWVQKQAEKKAKESKPAVDTTPPASEPPAPSGEAKTGLAAAAEGMGFRRAQKEEPPAMPAEEDEPEIPNLDSLEAIVEYKSTRLWKDVPLEIQRQIVVINAKGVIAKLNPDIAPYMAMSRDEARSWLKGVKFNSSMVGAFLTAMELTATEDDESKIPELFPPTPLTQEHLEFWQREMPGRTYIDLAYDAAGWGATHMAPPEYREGCKQWLAAQG